MVNTEKQREYSRRHYEKNREKKLKYGQTYRKEHNEIGLCQKCNQPVMPGFTRCIYHHYKLLEYHKMPERREINRIRASSNRTNMLIENKCLDCRAPLIEGENRICVACRIKKNESDSKVRRIKHATAN